MLSKSTPSLHASPGLKTVFIFNQSFCSLCDDETAGIIYAFTIPADASGDWNR